VVCFEPVTLLVWDFFVVAMLMSFFRKKKKSDYLFV